jgi:hypothetical protein
MAVGEVKRMKSQYNEKFEELEHLIAEYNAIHGPGKGEEISGSLMFSHGIEGQIQVFRKAKGREIILETNDCPDMVIVRYRKRRNSET